MVKTYLAEQASLVEFTISQYLKAADQFAVRLLEAMEYAIFNGGKRVRPALAIAVNQVLGGNVEQVLPFACALEMIHSYSLVHDDLPAMDNDDLRRGKPTCHVKYDEATAILAGDTLQVAAYDLLINLSQKAGLSEQKILELAKLLTKASGLSGMAAGQMLDLQYEGVSISLEQLQQIHQLKTGALLLVAVEAALVLNDVGESEATDLKNFGKAVGLAFQIKDDLLDVQSTAALLGKTPGKDFKTGKATYVSLLGVEQAEQYLAKETQKAYDAVLKYGENNILINIAKYLLERNN